MSVQKERSHHRSPSGSNTVDLWALLAAKLQSPTELHAYFLCPPLDHMEQEGHQDTVHHRFVCVCERVRVQECVICAACCLFFSLFFFRGEKEPNLPASVCGLGSRGAFVFNGICISLPAKSTFISSTTNIDAEKHFRVFSHSAALDRTQWQCFSLS